MAFNRGGNSTDLDVAFDYFRIESQGDPVPFAVGADGTVGGTVPPTLSLTLGTPAGFGAFTAGHRLRLQRVDDRQRDLDGGRRALSVADPSSANTGKLVNGAFALAAAAAGPGVQRRRRGGALRPSAARRARRRC